MVNRKAVCNKAIVSRIPLNSCVKSDSSYLTTPVTRVAGKRRLLLPLLTFFIAKLNCCLEVSKKVFFFSEGRNSYF